MGCIDVFVWQVNGEIKLCYTWGFKKAEKIEEILKRNPSVKWYRRFCICAIFRHKPGPPLSTVRLEELP